MHVGGQNFFVKRESLTPRPQQASLLTVAHRAPRVTHLCRVHFRYCVRFGWHSCFFSFHRETICPTVYNAGGHTTSSTNSDTQWPKKQTARMRAAPSERLHATLMSDVLRPASAHFSNPTICADDNSAGLEPSHSQVSNCFSALLIELPEISRPLFPSDQTLFSFSLNLFP